MTMDQWCLAGQCVVEVAVGSDGIVVDLADPAFGEVWKIAGS